MKPNFENFECVWSEGRGHALHYECPEDIVRLLVKFTQKFGGKASRISCVHFSLGLTGFGAPQDYRKARTQLILAVL